MMGEKYLGSVNDLKVLRGQPFFHECGRGEVHSPISGDVSHNQFSFLK
jgi:hypothetical protein